MKCHRCGESMTLFVVGDDYCPTCKRELAVIAEQEARRDKARARFSVVKELSPWSPRPAA